MYLRAMLVNQVCFGRDEKGVNIRGTKARRLFKGFQVGAQCVIY